MLRQSGYDRHDRRDLPWVPLTDNKRRRPPPLSYSNARPLVAAARTFLYRDKFGCEAHRIPRPQGACCFVPLLPLLLLMVRLLRVHLLASVPLNFLE